MTETTCLIQLWTRTVLFTLRVQKVESARLKLAHSQSHLKCSCTVGNENAGVGQCLSVAKSKKEPLSMIGQKDKRTLHCPTNGDPCPQANEKTMVTGGDHALVRIPIFNGCHKK